MGCTQSSSSNRRHPESKIYELLETLTLSFTDYHVSDDILHAKIDRTLTKIETTVQQIETISPFVCVEIQICLESLQKARPKLIKKNKSKFLKLLELSDSSGSPSKRGSSTKSGGRGNSTESATNGSTVPPTPEFHLRKTAGLGINGRNLSDSTQRYSLTLRNSSGGDEETTSAIKLKSLYQNTLNQSQETLDEYGFFEDHIT